MFKSVNYQIIEVLKKSILSAEDNTEIAIATAAYQAFITGLKIEIEVKVSIGVELNV